MKQNENYEKTYKEALDRASHIKDYNTIGTPQEIAELIFPELQESEDEKMIGTIRLALTDVPEERFTTEGTSLSKVYAWIDKKKEQEKCPEYCVRSHCIGCSIYEKRKEQKPILEVFGFKVGDAVRLKNGDGRKHIIKSFKEVEGIHGPNFYQVEFEDNSARDGIYPGKEYPNGYYTQMEKIEKKQKPAEFDEYKIIKKHITEDMLSSEVNKRLTECGWYVTDEEPAEWSEEDDKRLDRIVSFIWKNRKGDTSEIYQQEQDAKWLQSLRPQKQKEHHSYEKIKRCLAISFIHYLDEIRPEGKMCLSNGECADIDKAFDEMDWDKLVRYLANYETGRKD